MKSSLNDTVLMLAGGREREGAREEGCARAKETLVAARHRIYALITTALTVDRMERTLTALAGVQYQTRMCDETTYTHLPTAAPGRRRSRPPPDRAESGRIGPRDLFLSQMMKPASSESDICNAFLFCVYYLFSGALQVLRHGVELGGRSPCISIRACNVCFACWKF